MKEITITVENFDSEVMKSDKPVLIDFWAPWCGPCRMLAPIVGEIASERDDVKVCKVNVDEEMALAEAFKVASIPMLVVIKEGKITAHSIGYVTKKDVEALLEK